VQNSELRPLGAGEILDRAVTLFVRRFVPISVTLAIAIVPLLIIEAILAPASTNALGDIARAVAAGSRGETNGALAALSRDQTGPAAFAGVMAITFAGRILMWSAILAVASAAYAGAAVTVGAAYRVGVRCWFAQLVVGITFSILGMVALIPVFIGYVIAVIGVVLLAALHVETLAIVFAVIAGIVVLGGFLLVGAWVFMTYQVASAAIVLEALSPITAVTVALRRTFARATWWRTVVAGLIALVMTQGATLVFAAVGLLLAALTHLAPVSFAVLGVGQILVEGLLAVFVVVYATDMRVRREGFDLVAMTGDAAIEAPAQA
jgi:hypothetical protein